MKKLLSLSTILILVLTSCKKEITTPESSQEEVTGKPPSPPPPASILQWQKCLGTSETDIATAVANSVNNDGYFVAGYSGGALFSPNADAMVSKLDPGNGNILWQRKIGGSRFDMANGVVATPDGGCLIAGSTNSTDGDLQGVPIGGEASALLCKLSASGDKEWVTTLGSGVRAWSLISTSDGAFAAAGETGGAAWLVKFHITSIGHVIDWEKTYNVVNTHNGDNAYALTEAENGGFILAGRSVLVIGGSTNSFLRVFKTDNNGLVSWDNVFTNQPGIGWGVTTSKGSDGNIDGYVVTGNYTYDFFAIKFNLDGSIGRQKIIAGSTSGGIRGKSVISVGSGQGYIITGYTSLRNGEITASKGGTDLFVLPLDKDLNSISSKVYVFGGKGSDQGNALIATTPDSGYLIGGQTDSNNTGDVSGYIGNTDMWAIKVKF